MTFAALYAYGHLLAVAFSLSIALACAVVVWRVPRARRDLGIGLTLTYSLTAAASALAMSLALRPSLWAGRFYLAVGGAVFLSLVVTFHLQYAGEVLPERRRRAYWTAIAATAGYGLILFLLIVGGVLDGGHARTVSLWGAHATMPAMPLWACALCFVFATANVPLCAELYVREGPNRKSRSVAEGRRGSEPGTTKVCAMAFTSPLLKASVYWRTVDMGSVMRRGSSRSQREVASTVGMTSSTGSGDQRESSQSCRTT